MKKSRFGAFVPSVESPERKWIARVEAGVLIVNQIEPTLVQGTAVRFQFSKDQCRDRATAMVSKAPPTQPLLRLYSFFWEKGGCKICPTLISA
jgi:hypothetical protein